MIYAPSLRIPPRVLIESGTAYADFTGAPGTTGQEGNLTLSETRPGSQYLPRKEFPVNIKLPVR
jgi:hypothetical protein